MGDMLRTGMVMERVALNGEIKVNHGDDPEEDEPHDNQLEQCRIAE